MAKSLCSVLLMLLALSSVSTALQCLRCSDCRHEVEIPTTCRPGFDVCMKQINYNKVKKSCAPRVVCKPEEIDRSSPDIIQDLKTFFSSRDINRLINSAFHTRSKTVHCCETDYCNGSPGIRTSSGLLIILPLALYLLGC
ncbi:uncharacterized protein [Macrobrachium rosenbergii]|uniref:uncharacterized protein n=1 Tax=Macrobrachium rosenbergii TaxID=79674 RepID=UPI0034D525F1